MEAEKAVAIWIFVKELSSKVREYGDSMIAGHFLKISLKSGDAERTCFGGINDLVNSDLPIVIKTLAHYLYSLYSLLSAELLANIVNSE